jgi:hypothetical protein
VFTSVADPGSGIGFFRIPDLGSQTHIFDSPMTNFWVISAIILSVLSKKISLPVQKKIIYNFVIFVATTNGRTNIFFTPPLLVLLLDPG